MLTESLPVMTFPAVPENQGGLSWLDVSQCDAHPHEGLEGGSRKLPACQPDLGTREDPGVDHPECGHAAHTVQPGDHAQPAWV